MQKYGAKNAENGWILAEEIRNHEFRKRTYWWEHPEDIPAWTPNGRYLAPVPRCSLSSVDLNQQIPHLIFLNVPPLTPLSLFKPSFTLVQDT